MVFHQRNATWRQYIFLKEYSPKPDRQKAVALWKEAAEEGDSTSQYNYGMCLKRGKGGKKNKALAIEWLKRAASVGEEHAIAELRKMKIELE